MGLGNVPNVPNLSVNRTRRTSTISTLSIASNATDSGTIQIAKAFVLQSLNVSVAARVRLYQTTAQLLADAARPSTVAPTGNHGLIFESIGSGLIPTQFSVLGANKETNSTSNIPISITNQSGNTSFVTVIASFTPLED